MRRLSRQTKKNKATKTKNAFPTHDFLFLLLNPATSNANNEFIPKPNFHPGKQRYPQKLFNQKNLELAMINQPRKLDPSCSSPTELPLPGPIPLADLTSRTYQVLQSGPVSPRFHVQLKRRFSVKKTSSHSLFMRRYKRQRRRNAMPFSTVREILCRAEHALLAAEESDALAEQLFYLTIRNQV